MKQFQLPNPDDFVDMMKYARQATAEALAEAESAGRSSQVERCQDELAGWDALIMRVH